MSVFESRVSDIFGTVRAPFSFKKLARHAAREMEDQTLVINGVDTAPALYTILVASDDDAFLTPYYSKISREVRELVKAQAGRKRYTLVGEPLVRFMVDPALKSGRFSVFAENVDAPTLGRLYEEERAYQQKLTGEAGVNVPEARGAVHSSFEPSPVAIPDPVATVPPTVLRDQLPGMGGAAATGGVLSVASNMADARQAPAAPRALLKDVVTGEEHPISRARCIIGRERATADIALRDPNVSRCHAELAYTGTDWSIEDLNSTNGTMVNNRRITRCPLRDGDLLTFGLSTFEFRS
nr:FhaA domain-containing protein [Collinsella urealyticum]